MNNYYIYVYLDPRKQGEYVYGDYNFEYEPFYIGKGHGNRCYDHLKESQLTKVNGNKPKQNKLKKLLKLDLKPIIVKVICDLNEPNALIEEVSIIKVIGRLNTKSGPLLNLTDGGDGCKSMFITEEQRKKMSITMKNYYKNNPVSKETCDKISNVLLSKNIVRSQETKDKIGIANKNRKYSEEYINYLREIRKGCKFSHRTKYKIISPEGVITYKLGRVELDDFINTHNLSVRKLIQFINKGIIKMETIRNVKNNKKVKSINCVGWEIKILPEVEWIEVLSL